VAEYQGIDSGRGTYAERAAGHLFELDHLQIGKLAPDFEATDENGVKWKLSDYRGKVVVVDFWGFW
jgi:cytochrome oxidase Cu insertion factor (SCO1/SenC/PrrC family)